MDETPNICKYCRKALQDSVKEGLKCALCNEFIHLDCLRRGSVPGGLIGDVFYTFTCEQCSDSGKEVFLRDKLSWLQIIVLVFYHMNNKSPGLARKGFFHWRYHIAMFIDKNWDVIFKRDVKKKKSWTGTVAGTLSHFSIYFFLSGTAVFKEQAWWALKYPKLSPNHITKIYNMLCIERQKSKISKVDLDLFNDVLQKCVANKDLLTPFAVSETLMKVEDEASQVEQIENEQKPPSPPPVKDITTMKRKTLLPTYEYTSKKIFKVNSNSNDGLSSEVTPARQEKSKLSTLENGTTSECEKKKLTKKLLDPFCHYNTSLSNLSRLRGFNLQTKLMGGIRQEMILSPYSAIYLKPYIRRDVETTPHWLKIMAEIQLRANKNNPDYVLPPRGPLDYTYVQPQHIPAINSLCNQFFWAGIDVTDCLQYPDFSCVVHYKKLIVAFALMVPDVQYTENYISFIFTRPGWRNCGIAKFMLYHLIQTSLGKDITLHVSINNSALFLYQKFGFKVEHVVLDFYNKYLRTDANESKHAFFCRLERH